MRKALCGVGFVFLISLLFSGCNVVPKSALETPAPEFDKPNSIVLDAWSSKTKRYEDYIKVHNATTKEQITFNIYAYDSKQLQWMIVGAAALKKAADSVTVESALAGDLDKYRWFAIQSLDGLEFKVQLTVDHNDIYITVFE